MAFNWGDDIIDSRDIIERRDELEAREEVATDGEVLFPEPPLDADEEAELALIREALDEIDRSSEDSPESGIALIADSYFVQYAQEYADDVGAIPRDAGWPTAYIDWDRAADALRMDFASIEIEGVTYWVR